MLKLAIFGNITMPDYTSKIEEIIHSFIAEGFEISIYKNFKESIQSQSFSISKLPEFTNLSAGFDIVISLGGDGTFLKCAHLCYKTNIPILGINFGKLGFLAQTKPDDIDFIIQNLKNKNYTIRHRSLLDFSYFDGESNQKGIGLNEITLQKSNAVKLIKLNVYVSDEFLCSFWADGIAVSTPTGSTGYSLSLGAPILTPDNKSLIITPIAPHTLSIRPIIIPDTETIKVEATGEFTHYLISNDYLSQTIQKQPIVEIKKSEYTISTIEFNNTRFFKTLRDKLILGYDIRK